LPVSGLALATLRLRGDRIGFRDCGAYIHAVQRAEWFMAAFSAYTDPVTVAGGGGRSHADARLRLVKIGTEDRSDVGKCEQACLHELAHIVTPDCDQGRELREPARGIGSTRGHHHAWRANFILIVKMSLGKQAAMRLRHEFAQWGLPTRK
jgi:hypothetical protein